MQPRGAFYARILPLSLSHTHTHTPTLSLQLRHGYCYRNAAVCAVSLSHTHTLTLVLTYTLLLLCRCVRSLEPPLITVPHRYCIEQGTSLHGGDDDDDDDVCMCVCGCYMCVHLYGYHTLILRRAVSATDAVAMGCKLYCVHVCMKPQLPHTDIASAQW